MNIHLLVSKFLVLFFAAFQLFDASAQPTVADPRTGCKIKMISVGDSPPKVSWDGGCSGGFANGLGTVVFLDSGNRYTGEMRDGWRNGQGKMAFADGNTYEGSFVDSKFNGRGVYIFSNGQRVEGQFRDGNANGACEITLPSRVRLSGQCVDGEIVGQGIGHYPDGGRYEGGFVASEPSGQGAYVGPKRQFRQEGIFKGGRMFSGRAYMADDSYQNIENGKPVGEIVVSPITQATMVLNAIASEKAKQNGSSPSVGAQGTGKSDGGYSRTGCAMRANGEIYSDLASGLDIQRCNVGETWSRDTCVGTRTKLSWDEAMRQYGQGSWRLPSKAESEKLLRSYVACQRSSSNTPNVYGMGTSWVSERSGNNVKPQSYLLDFAQPGGSDNPRLSSDYAHLKHGVYLVRSK